MLVVMRRASDIGEGERTGEGRRARDRLLEGRAAAVPDSVPAERRGELQNVMLFVGDDLRESALAVGGIETFLVHAQRLLERPDVSADELAALVEDGDLDRRLQALDDAVTALRRSVSALSRRM
jgi:hypothetical protein